MVLKFFSNTVELHLNTLYLVRHAKSSWKDHSLSDQDRPLNRRGKESAPMMAQRLLANEVMIDRIISSPAKRAHTTARKLAQGIGYNERDIELVDGLYFEGIETMMSIVQSAGPDCQSLMLVAHNPDMTHLLNSLVGYTTDNMPTCAIATIGFRESWQEVDFGKGVLIDYDYPKRLD